MKIGFSTSYEGPGGARSWIKGFSSFCIRKGHTVSFGFDDTVDVFCSVANLSTEQELIDIKSKNIKILQRLGAIYMDYDHPNPLLIKNRNNNIKNLIKHADAIIYQSIFSKEELFGSIYDGNEPYGDIIYNCANPNVFTPVGPTFDRPKDKKVILASSYWGTPHTTDKSVDILIEFLKKYEHREDIEFWILGRAFPRHDALLRSYNFKNVTKLEVLDAVPHNDMPTMLRTVDMVLHLKFHEACPNMALEMMFSGTPFVSMNTGSLKELVGDAALLCNSSRDISTFPTADMEDFYIKFEQTLDNTEYFSNKLLERSKNFNEEVNYQQYLNKLEELCK